MLIIALVLNMLGIGLFCWLGLTLAVYALPCFVALSAGLAAVHAGTGMPPPLWSQFLPAR